MSETPASLSRTSSPRTGFSYLYMMAAFVVVVAGIRAAESIINPLLLAIFLSVMSAPAYLGLLKRNVPNWLALLTVIGVLSGLVLAVVWIVLGSIISFSSRQDHYTELLRERTSAITEPLDRWLMESQAIPERRDDPEQDDSDSLLSGQDAAAAIEGDSKDSDERTTVEIEGDDAAGQEVIAVNSSDDPGGDADREASPTLERPADSDLANAESTEDQVEFDPQNVSSLLIPPVVDSFGFPQDRRPAPKDKKGWEELLSNQFNPRMFISLTLTLMTELAQILSNAFLILLTVIFILLEVGTFRRKIGDAFTQDEELATRATQVVTSIQHYIVIKTWVSLGTGVIIALWLKFLGVPYAGLWGLLAFLFNFIPNIGSIIAAVPAVLIAWLELTTAPAVAAAFGFLVVNGVLGNFFEPKWMGKGLGLSPLVVFCSLVFWGWVLGPVGMLLSVPLTKTARIALDGFDDTRFVATLLSD